MNSSGDRTTMPPRPFVSLMVAFFLCGILLMSPVGPYKGAVTEAIADPWLERRGGFEWRGSPYTSELVSDLMLQLMDMGLVKTP